MYYMHSKSGNVLEIYMNESARYRVTHLLLLIDMFDSSRNMKKENKEKNDEKQECVHTHIVFDYYYYYNDGCRMI